MNKIKEELKPILDKIIEGDNIGGTKLLNDYFTKNKINFKTAQIEIVETLREMVKEYYKK